MEEDKKVNEVETSILENPLDNTKIDITGDLTKMVDEVKNAMSAPIVENKDENELEKDIPVIEPKSSDENVSNQSSVEIVTEKKDVVSSDETKIDTSVYDGTVITSISSSDNKENSVEKKKIPLNIFVVLGVLIGCVVLGFFSWHFFRNDDGSYKAKYFESLREKENEEEKLEKPVDKEPVTSGDDVVSTPSDDVIYTFNSGKYIFNNKTLYLYNDGTFYYLINDEKCPTSYFGDYTVDGNMIDLTSTAAHGCNECEDTVNTKLNFYVFNIRSDGRISLNREVFDYVGMDESDVPPLTCGNENAN